MKYSIVFAILILINSCSEFETVSEIPLDKKSKTSSINKTQIDERCDKKIQEVNIFQVIPKEGALASVCDATADYCNGNTVFIPENEELFWDDKRIKPKEDMCFSIEGTYRYKTKGENMKTVPILGFQYKYPPKDNEEIEMRINDLKKSCIFQMTNKHKVDISKGEKMCNCYIDFFKDIAIKASRNDDINLDHDESKWQERAERKCGKVPGDNKK